jgi:hypothetical protein
MSWLRRPVLRGELISAVAALALLVFMFVFAWYGLAGIPGRSAVVATENGWHGLTIVRWLILLTIAVTLGANRIRNGSALVAGLGTLTALLLTYRVLIDLPSSQSVVDQKLGAYLAVLSAFAIALGGYDSLRAQRGVQIRLGGETPGGGTVAADPQPR